MACKERDVHVGVEGCVAHVTVLEGRGSAHSLGVEMLHRAQRLHLRILQKGRDPMGQDPKGRDPTGWKKAKVGESKGRA